MTSVGPATGSSAGQEATTGATAVDRDGELAVIRELSAAYLEAIAKCEALELKLKLIESARDDSAAVGMKRRRTREGATNSAAIGREPAESEAAAAREALG